MESGARGTIIKRGAGKARPQIIEVKGRRWSAKAEAEFLACLSTGANVSRAIRECNFSRSTIYNRRTNYPEFAAKWAEAKEMAWDHLDTLLIENGTNLLEGVPIPEGNPIPQMTMSEVIAIVGRRKAAGKQGGAHAGRPLEPSEGEAAKQSILRKVAALRKAKGLA